MLFLLGCGVERYDRRFLENSKTLLTEQAQLNENLTSNWSERGIQLRPPAGFEEQPLPSKGPASIRLPSRKPLVLPGLLGVFTSEIGAVTSDGDTLEVPASIAVLSNREFLESRGTEEGDTEKKIDPEEFLDDVRGKLMDALPSGGSKQDSITVGGRGFQPTVRYVTSEFEAKGSQGISYEVTLYAHEQEGGEVHVAIIVIAPAETARDEPLETQVPISLRTLRIDKSGSGAESAAGTPAGPSF